MSNTRHSSPERQMKPMIMVFCEGATEDEYINLLRTRYHAQIKIVSRITGQQLSPKMISRYIKVEKLKKRILSIHF